MNDECEWLFVSVLPYDILAAYSEVIPPSVLSQLGFTPTSHGPLMHK